MKTINAIRALSLALLATLLLAGCDTFQSRAREKSETFASLPADTQQRLQRGKIDLGDTQDMVYIALGLPDERRQTTTADGVQETWIYRAYWQQYEGQVWAGWRRIVVPNPTGRGYMIFHEPVSRDVYSTRANDVIRVTMNRGVVELVEQQIGR